MEIEDESEHHMDAVRQALLRLGVEVGNRKIEFQLRNEHDPESHSLITRVYVHIEKGDGMQGPMIPLDQLEL